MEGCLELGQSFSSQTINATYHRIRLPGGLGSESTSGADHQIRLSVVGFGRGAGTVAHQACQLSAHEEGRDHGPGLHHHRVRTAAIEVTEAPVRSNLAEEDRRERN